MGLGFKRGGQVAYATVNVSAQAGGTASGGGKFVKGRPVTVVAAPGSSYSYDFVGWYEGDTLVSSSASYTFTLTRNISLQARFILVQYTVSTTAQPGGSASGGGTVNRGGNVTVTASATAAYNFAGWYDGDTLVSSSASYTFAPTKSVTLQARFAIKTYTVSVSASAGGNASGGGSVAHGNNVTVSASPSAGYYFVGWYNGSVLLSSSTTYTFAVTSNISIQARFAVSMVTIHPSVSSYTKPTYTFPTKPQGVYINGFYEYINGNNSGQWPMDGGLINEYLPYGQTTLVVYGYQGSETRRRNYTMQFIWSGNTFIFEGAAGTEHTDRWIKFTPVY